LKLRDRGLTATEVAEALGVSPNTVFVYLRKSKA
jgi:predicted transcriptional regulator